MSSSKDNKYKIIDFTYSKDDEVEDKKFEIKNYKYEHKYLISKETYEDGIKFLKKKTNKSYNKDIFYYFKYKKIIEGEDYVLVDEKFLEALECKDEAYNGKFVVYFESEGKHFIYFYDEEILEITDINKENKEEEENKNKISDDEENENENNKENARQEMDENDEQNIIKSLILIYANEKQFQKILDSPIVDEYDLKNYYLINQSFIEEYKNNNDYKGLSEILDAKEYNYSYKGFCFNMDKILEIPQIKKLKLKKKQ